MVRNSELKFKDLLISAAMIDNLEQTVLGDIQSRANGIYVAGNYSVANAWIKAVLEHLYAIEVLKEDGSVDAASLPGLKALLGGTHD